MDRTSAAETRLRDSVRSNASTSEEIIANSTDPPEQVGEPDDNTRPAEDVEKESSGA